PPPLNYDVGIDAKKRKLPPAKIGQRTPVVFRRFRIVVEQSCTDNEFGLARRSTRNRQPGENTAVAFRTDVQYGGRTLAAAVRRVLACGNAGGQDGAKQVVGNPELRELLLDIGDRARSVRQENHRAALPPKASQSFNRRSMRSPAVMQH